MNAFKIVSLVFLVLVLGAGYYGYSRYQHIAQIRTQPNNIPAEGLSGTKSNCESAEGRSLLERVTFKDGNKAQFEAIMHFESGCKGLGAFKVEAIADYKGAGGVKADLSDGLVELQMGQRSLTLLKSGADEKANKESWCGLTRWQMNVPQVVGADCEQAKIIASDHYLLDLSTFQ